ncbi:MAG: hypothetical protein OXH04_24420, partial [Acidobacteria bacterium]|nr:hypothetical protein [Acidobacteriota bacterium]
LEHPRFARGAVDIGFVDDERAALAGGVADESVLAAVTAAAARAGRQGPHAPTPGAPAAAAGAGVDPWVALRDWRL